MQWQVAVRVIVSGERDADVADAIVSEELLLTVLIGKWNREITGRGESPVNNLAS